MDRLQTKYTKGLFIITLGFGDGVLNVVEKTVILTMINLAFITLIIITSDAQLVATSTAIIETMSAWEVKIRILMK